jgi:hypothetical protein
MARHLQAAHSRHLDVEQHDLRLALRNELDRFHAVARFADHAGGHLGRDVAEQLLQPLAGRGLVVDDENLERHAMAVR